MRSAAARAEAEELNRRLRVELATLKSLSRIEGKARTELGMVAPARDQVRLAREFVRRTAGRATARRSARSAVAEHRGTPCDVASAASGTA